MGDPQRNPATDAHGIFGIPKAMCKTYKFVTKWNSDNKSSPNKSDAEEHKFEEKFSAYMQAQVEDNTMHRVFHSKSIDDSLLSRQPSLGKCASRRSHTPSPRSSSYSNMTANMSRRSETPQRSSLSRSNTRKFTSESETRSSGTSDASQNPSMSRNASRRSPIIFSQTTAARRKPPPIERKLSCTLEQLCLGGAKKIMIKREIVLDNGNVMQEEESLTIKLKPGWKKGTKITFEGKGDQKPGYHPADIIFQIEEKRHPLFRREGDDLEIAVEIPLVQALTGCSLSVPVLGGKSIDLTLDDIICPGFELVIPGHGMPNPKEKGKRGDLRIRFFVEFPVDLTEEQRYEASKILEDCS
ncbi:dnaJ homolog subfamily B member 13-like [Pistacia vera]|uniref:Uncharacterized protein n=1 Tax=Pistacia integerrima TaxID=434235 RepID=A0ACC0X944_9ROSI|nr:dnaJ homolog subfamily B member 13-like [Pistacia vera]KAJ0011509.1 hypothetical protein Pint_33132 [Pistacia integerrima]